MPRVGFLFGAVTGAREVNFDAIVDAFEGCCDTAGVECVEEHGDATSKASPSPSPHVLWRRVMATSDGMRHVFETGCAVVHFCGHGDGRGLIALTASAAGMDLHTADDVAALLAGAPTPSLVILAACFSELIASAFVELGVPHVVAVDRVTEISEAAMVLFAREFYSALLSDDGHAPSVGAAFAAAVEGLMLAADGVKCRCRACGGGSGREAPDAREKFAAAAQHLVLLPPGRHDNCHPFDGVIARRHVRAPASADWALPLRAPGVHSFPRALCEARLLDALSRGDRFVYVAGDTGSGKSHIVGTVLERFGRSRNAHRFWKVYHVDCSGPAAAELSCSTHCEARFMALLVGALTRAPFVLPDGAATSDACTAAPRDALRAAVDAVKRRHRRVLLVLDGVDNDTGTPTCPLFGVVRRVLFGVEADDHISGLLVECPNLCVVMTSRGLSPGVRGVPVLESVAPALLPFSSDVDVTGMAADDVGRFWAHAADCTSDQLHAWFAARASSRVELDQLLSAHGNGRVFYMGPLSRAAAVLRVASCRQTWVQDYVRACSPGLPVVPPTARPCRGGRLLNECIDAYERAFVALKVDRWREAHLGFWGHVEGGPDAVHEIQEWLSSAGAASGSRSFVLHGPAARGKSAVAAALSASHAEACLPGVAVAIHFLQSFNSATWALRLMILSIAHQLRVRSAGGCGWSTALPTPADGPPSPSWCVGALKDALGSSPSDRGVIIVVDGLDDTCGGAANQCAILSVLATILSELPVSVRLLVTCRAPDDARRFLPDATVSRLWEQRSKADAYVAEIRARFSDTRARVPTIAVQTVLEVLGVAEAPLDACEVLRAVASRRPLPGWSDGATALAALESVDLFRVCRDTWLVEPCHNVVFELTRDVAISARGESFVGFLDRLSMDDQTLPLLTEDDDDYALACYLRDYFSISTGATSLKYVSCDGEEGSIDLRGAVLGEDNGGLWFRLYTAERMLDLRAADADSKNGWMRALRLAVEAAPRPPLPCGCYFVRFIDLDASPITDVVGSAAGGVRVDELSVEVFDAHEAALRQLEWTYVHADVAALDARLRRLRDGRSGGALLPPQDCVGMMARLSAYLHALTASSRVNPAVLYELRAFWSSSPKRHVADVVAHSDGRDEDAILPSCVCVVRALGRDHSRMVFDEADVVRSCCADVYLPVSVYSGFEDCDRGSMSVLHVCGLLGESGEDNLVRCCCPPVSTTDSEPARPDVVIVSVSSGSDIVARLVSVGVAQVMSISRDVPAFTKAAFTRHFYALYACEGGTVFDAFAAARDAVSLEFPGSTLAFELMRCSTEPEPSVYLDLPLPRYFADSFAQQQRSHDDGSKWRVPRPLRSWFDGTGWLPGTSSAGDVMGKLFETLCSGTARCVHVCGDAEVGKTHVVREALRRARDMHIIDAAYYVSCAPDPRLRCSECCEAAFVGLLIAELSGLSAHCVRSDSLAQLRAALLSAASRASAHRNVVLVIDGCDAVPPSVLESALFGSMGVLARCAGLCAVLTSRRPMDESVPAFAANGTMQLYVARFGVEAAVAFFVSCLCPNWAISEKNRAIVETRLRSSNAAVLADDGRKWESLFEHALFASETGGGRIAGKIAATADKILRRGQRMSTRSAGSILELPTVANMLRTPDSVPPATTAAARDGTDPHGSRCTCGGRGKQESEEDMQRGLYEMHNALRRIMNDGAIDSVRVRRALGMAGAAAVKFEQLVGLIHERSSVPPARAAAPGGDAYSAFRTRAPQVGADWHPETRLWLLARVRDWLGGPDRVQWLHGDAGVGKTVIATMVGSVFGAAATHFCAYNIEDTRNPELVVASVSFQLRLRFPSSYSPPVSELGLRDGEALEALWNRAIVEHVSRISEAERGGPVLIVIDALDEAARGNDANNGVADLLLGCRSDSWPAWLKLFVTSRETLRLRRDFHEHALSVDAAGADNVGDVRVVVQDVLRDVTIAGGGGLGGGSTPGGPVVAPLTRDDAVSIIVRKAAGIFLYVAYVRDKLKSMPSGVQLDREFFTDLPRDVRDIISQSMRRMREVLPGRSLDLIRPLFEVIVAATEPLTLDVLAAAARLSVGTMRAANRAVSISGLFRSLPGGELQPFHKVVVDWLEDSSRGRVERVCGHVALAGWSRVHLFGSRSVAVGQPRCCDPNLLIDRYAFLYHVHHCVESRCIGSRGGIVAAGGKNVIPADEWVREALTAPGVIDGAINCGGGAALMRQLWVLIAQPSLRASLIGVLAWLGVCRDVWQSNTVAALRCAVGGRFGTIVSTAASKWALTRFPVLWASSGICSPAVVSEGPSVAIASMILRGHTAAVNCVSVTGDGLYIVSCGNDDSVRMWDSASGDPTCVMKTDDSVRSVSCHSGDGRRVVSGDEDGAVKLWRIVDCGALEEECTVRTDRMECCAVCLSRSGKLVASGSEGGVIRVRLCDSLASSTSVCHILRGHRKEVLSVAFSAPDDGALLVSGGGDGRVILWDIRGAVGSIVWNVSSRRVNCVAFSPNGMQVASASLANAASLLDAKTGQCIREFLLDNVPAMSVCFHPEGHELACGDRNGVIHLWDVASGKYRGTLAGHSEAVNSLIYLPDGARLVSGSSDRTVRVWDATQTAAVAGAPADTRATSVSHDGHRVALGYANGQIIVLDTRRNCACADFVAYKSGGVRALAWSPDGKQLASCSDADGAAEMRVWLVESGAMLCDARDECSIYSLSWSADGQRIAGGRGLFVGVRMWNASNGAVLGDMRGELIIVRCVAFSPEPLHHRLLLASGCEDGTVCVWDALSFALVHVLAVHEEAVWAVCWSRDGRRVASGSSDKSVRVWNPESGAMLRKMQRQHDDIVRAVCFSPSGSRIVSSGLEGCVIVSNVELGACLCVVLLPHAAFNALWAHEGTRNDVVFICFGGTTSTAFTRLVVIHDVDSSHVVVGPEAIAVLGTAKMCTDCGACGDMVSCCSCESMLCQCCAQGFLPESSGDSSTTGIVASSSAALAFSIQRHDVGSDAPTCATCTLVSLGELSRRIAVTGGGTGGVDHCRILSFPCAYGEEQVGEMDEIPRTSRRARWRMQARGVGMNLDDSAVACEWVCSLCGSRNAPDATCCTNCTLARSVVESGPYGIVTVPGTESDAAAPAPLNHGTSVSASSSDGVTDSNDGTGSIITDEDSLAVALALSMGDE